MVRPTSIDITGYVERMTAHCPYPSPSIERGLTTWTVYRADGSADAVEAELFHAGAQAAERLRPLIRRPHGSLRCENVVILGEVPGVEHRDLLAWPHWALKNLYGPAGIMFGKFYAGEEENTRAGERIPLAPVSFLPVRAAIRRRDPQFLHATLDLAAALSVADDDGRDLLGQLPYDWQEIRTWAQRFLPPPRRSASSRTMSDGLSRPGS
ncbi:DUF6875 domain-containing protein [Streptomyces microflavus]|uniref:DUF6875 domain-containing protein n=1 Tax=Streptomyces microflavus TaxID=1919 RepID=UPI002E3564E9|nr:hypothetical protein [Streptomyces microflavus]